MVQRDLPGCEGGSGQGGKRKRKPGADVPGVKEAIATFHDAFVRAYGARPTWGVKNGAIMKRLVKEHGIDEVKRRIAVLFDRGLGKWPEPPYTIGVLSSQFDRLVADVRPTRGVRPSDVLGKGEP